MAHQEAISFDGNGPLSQEHLQQITCYLHDINDSAKNYTITIPKQQQQQQQQQLETSNMLSLEPPKPEQLAGFLQFLYEYYWSTTTTSAKSHGNNTDAATKRPTLLTIGSGSGLLSVATTHFQICSQAIGIFDANHPTTISHSKKLAFQQKVLAKCHFFEIEDLHTVNPKLVLDNPHFMADIINEADVVFVYELPNVIYQMIPLLALLSSKKKERKFVTCLHHLPVEFAVRPAFIEGTDLCVYDGVDDALLKRKDYACPPPPDPVDGDEIDKDFARSSIRHALPER